MSNALKTLALCAAAVILSLPFVAFDAPWWAVLPPACALGLGWDRIWSAALAALARARGEETP